jgi:hypothetical protein
MVNEFIVSVCCYHLLFFTDEVPIETQETYGWSLVTVVSTLSGINLLMVLVQLA